MCTTPKIKTVVQQQEVPKEEIKAATYADASVQKSDRIAMSGLASQNIRTSNIGVDDEITSSKKKLLGE